jgi:hypothetical protein
MSKNTDWHGIAVGATVAILILAGVMIVSHYEDRKEARKKIENCEFKLRDNAEARRIYIATAPEIAQNKHLHRVIDSIAQANDSLTNRNPKEYKKNQGLISRLMWIADYNDSVANVRIAEFDSTRNQLLREIKRYQEKLK